MTLMLNSLLFFFFDANLELMIVSQAIFLKDIYHPFEMVGHMYSTVFMNDGLSSIMAILSYWISMLMVLSISPSSRSSKKLKKTIVLLLMILLFFFLSVKKIWFFIFFEFSLFPIFYMILGWGYQSERMMAVFYFLVYTIFFSIPFLMSLLFFEQDAILFLNMEMKHVSATWSFLLLLVLMIKMPLFFTHFWLPKAHVEAPVVGSMVLAGVLLKMGGYGIARFCLLISPSNCAMKMYTTISTVGSVIISFVCLFCSDMKQLIAYSSVSHMNFMVIGMMEGSKISMNAAYMLMVVHGLSSSSMFYFADLVYKRSGSRSFLVSKGILNFLPMSGFWVFLNVMASAAVPPFLSSFSEMAIISSMFFKSFIFFFFLFTYAFLSVFYQIFFYYSLLHGSFEKKNFFFPLSLKENLNLFLHQSLLFFLVFLAENFII